MARNSAEFRGRARVRAFRVAQIVDPTSSEAVLIAISNLTQAWGGYYTPIFDATLPPKDIELQARAFDVDALHIPGEDGELLEQLGRTDWLWQGAGEFGPFAAAEEGFRTGVLPVRVLALDQPSLLLPEWDDDDPLSLFYSAVFGAPVNFDGSSGEYVWEPAASQRIGLGAAFAIPGVSVDDIGMIQATRVGLSPEIRHFTDWINGLFVVRPDHPQDLIAFWNLRSLGRPVVALPDDGSEQLLELLTRGTVPGSTSEYFGPNARTEKYLGVWGLANASTSTRNAIDAMADRLGMVVRDHHPIPGDRAIFPGLDSRFRASVRAEFPSNMRSVMVRVPSVPLVPDAHQIMPGTVAVEIDVNEVPGLDPRSTPSLPPLRRFGSLLKQSGMSRTDHVRVSLDGNGVVLGVSATSDEVAIGFAYHLDAIALLFDDDKLKVSQSDLGRFQTRAAEMLGGPFGGVMVQPGVRALIDRAGRSTAGLTLQQLRAEIRNNRGAWPDKLTSFRTSAEEYAEYAVNSLLLTGLFVPMLDVHCSNCRVESQVPPRDLDTSLNCEFCGETFRLAISLALSKSRWRYRLASHLGPDKVKALLPALATSSLLGQLTSRYGPAGAHAFGVEFKFSEGKRIEADVVAYLAQPDWALAIAEVKSGNWIDQNDVQNLENLQLRLDEKKARSVLTFSSLKAQLAEEEVVALRGLVERGVAITTADGVTMPRLPLVLTSNDLSLPWSADDHPWKWPPRGARQGIFRVAIESCRRNLGLVEVRLGEPKDGRPFTCTWREPSS